MLRLVWPVYVLLAYFAFHGSRWAYAGFVSLSLGSFAARAGFHLQPFACEMQFDAELALLSLTNYRHMVLFAFFCILSHAQCRGRGWPGFIWSVSASVVMGALVEIAQGLSGSGHCRARDLIPDLVGALIGVGLLLLWQRRRARDEWRELRLK